MSFGFTFVASVKGQGIFQQKPPIKETLAHIEAALNAAITDPLLQRLKHFEKTDNTLTMVLHPAGGEMCFTMDNPASVRCEAQTNTVGPGFHAFLIDLLDIIAMRCNLQWQATKDGGDETGYWNHRDFDRLQSELHEWLQHVARVVIERGASGELAHICLGMPLDYHPAGSYFAASAMGYWDREWFQRMLVQETAGDGATEFFPWWERGLTARTLRNIGMVMAWHELPWRPPINTRERQRYQLALECFRRAQQAQSDISLPRQEIAEMTSLLQNEGEHLAPSASGIGFRRKVACYPLPGGWSISVPGFFPQEFDEQGTTTFYFAEMSIDVSTLSVTDNTGRPTPREKAIEHVRSRPVPDGAVRIEEEDRHLFRLADFTHVTEEGRSFWRMSGWHVMAGQFCVTTICFDSTDDKTWALDVWRSIMHPAE